LAVISISRNDCKAISIEKMGAFQSKVGFGLTSSSWAGGRRE
jgi:hypothetical protein